MPGEEKGEQSRNADQSSDVFNSARHSEDLTKLKADITAQLSAAEAARKKAEEDAALAKTLLEEIQRGKAVLESELQHAQAARKKADEDATYAYQAKVNTENHAKAVSEFKGKAESEFTTISTNSQKSSELLQAITVGKTSADSDVKVISAHRRAIDQAADSIIDASKSGTSKLQDLDSSKIAATSVLKEIEKFRDDATKAASSSALAQKDAEKASTNAGGLETKISELHESAAELSKEIGDALTAAKGNEVSLAGIVDRLKKSHETATGFETRVEKSSGEFESLVKRLESLLPGATSASLASSFNAQKKRFSRPQKLWLAAFVVCIFLLVGVAVPSFIEALKSTTEINWDRVLRGLVMRLPIVIPLVWLAIYAGRNYMLSLRLEEDYAYKEAISTAFEGYKREMEKINVTDGNTPAPITTLCINVLRAIAERPGRMYEGKTEDITLFAETKALAEKADELRKKKIAEL